MSEKPLLLGILVDVSGSMTESIHNEGNATMTRLESVRSSLEALVQEAKSLSTESSEKRQQSIAKLFVYAFGFGNPLARLLGSGSDVRDLLQLHPGAESTLSVEELASDWQTYKSHVETLVLQMFGSTPMGEAFRLAQNRFLKEMAKDEFAKQPVLFVLSDGEPTDASEAEIVEIAKSIRAEGVIIVSCYVTSADLAQSRRVYGEAPSDWPAGAKLMLECSSSLPPNSSFSSYLREYKWTIDEGGRFFSQVNQSETLSEFMNAILSPLKPRYSGSEKGHPLQSASDLIPSTVNDPSIEPVSRLDEMKDLFLSHSSEDKKYVREFAEAVGKKLKLTYWLDECEIKIGDNILDRLNHGLKSSHYFVAFVSPNYIASAWGRTELDTILALQIRSKSRNRRCIPILLNCEESDLENDYPILIPFLSAKWSEGIDAVVESVRSSVSQKGSISSRSAPDPRAERWPQRSAYRLPAEMTERQIEELLTVYDKPSPPGEKMIPFWKTALIALGVILGCILLSWLIWVPPISQSHPPPGELSARSQRLWQYLVDRGARPQGDVSTPCLANGDEQEVTFSSSFSRPPIVFIGIRKIEHEAADEHRGANVEVKGSTERGFSWTAWNHPPGNWVRAVTIEWLAFEPPTRDMSQGYFNSSAAQGGASDPCDDGAFRFVSRTSAGRIDKEIVFWPKVGKTESPAGLDTIRYPATVIPFGTPVSFHYNGPVAEGWFEPGWYYEAASVRADFWEKKSEVTFGFTVHENSAFKDLSIEGNFKLGVLVDLNAK